MIDKIQQGDKSKVKDWWVENPQAYVDAFGLFPADSEKKVRPGTKDFFEQADESLRAQFSNLHETKPFDKIFNYRDYVGKNVLEVGCGLGYMACQWGLANAKVSAVDVNPQAITLAQKRFELSNVDGVFEVADIQHLPFADNKFDYVYAWGVLNHVPDIESSLAEIMRVLKPGGGFGFMVYNRNSLTHRYLTQYVEGFLHYENRFLGHLELSSRYSVGGAYEGSPFTWPYRKKGMLRRLAPYANSVQCETLGMDLDLILRDLMPGIGRFVPKFMIKPWARRFGWNMWFTGFKG